MTRPSPVQEALEALNEAISIGRFSIVSDRDTILALVVKARNALENRRNIMSVVQIDPEAAVEFVESWKQMWVLVTGNPFEGLDLYAHPSFSDTDEALEELQELAKTWNEGEADCILVRVVPAEKSLTT